MAGNRTTSPSSAEPVPGPSQETRAAGQPDLRADRKRVYLDNNATSMVDPQVAEAIYPYFRDHYANASSPHRDGAIAAQAVLQARTRIAAPIGAHRDEIVFTSGGTESDNLAIRGVLAAHPSKRHIVTTTVEHLAVLMCCRQCEKEGCEVTYLGVDPLGRLDLDALGAAIRNDTALVSVMYANNETGVLFPLERIAQVVGKKGCLLHVDAVQAFGKVPIDLGAVPVDLLSLSAHKIHGPKGIGALYVRRETPIAPIFYGGSHEYGLRPGTENVPGIVGFGAAAALAAGAMQEHHLHMEAMRDRFESEVLRLFPLASVNGDTENRLPNTSNISFEGWDSRELLAQLDRHGIDASGGSACCAQTEAISHVLAAMHIPPQRARGAIRFSLSRFTTAGEIEGVMEVLGRVLEPQARPHTSGRFPVSVQQDPRPSSDTMHRAVEATSEGEAEMDDLQQQKETLQSRKATTARPEEMMNPQILQAAESITPASDVSAPPPAPPPSTATAVREDTGPAAAGQIDPSADDSRSESPVYALGTLDFDFGTEARRDSIAQGNPRDTAYNVYDVYELLRDFDAHPWEAAVVIWTLKQDDIPIYAIAPDGPFADETYRWLRETLGGQLDDISGLNVNLLDDEKEKRGKGWERIERISVPGRASGQVRLLSGQVVPVVRPERRGLYRWRATDLTEKTEKEGTQNFMDRVYYELRNMGRTDEERAINYAATKSFHTENVFEQAHGQKLVLQGIDVEPSPIGRPGSNPWDVKLTFFHPTRRHQRAKQVYRFTVDVSEVIPVTIGEVRSWAAY